jgi:hypothetical protein
VESKPLMGMPRNTALPSLALALTISALSGCTSAATKVATAQNSYDWRLNRYLETCQVANPPAPCKARQDALKGYEKALHEAAIALKWGGKMPLQLKALETWDKAAAK